MRSSSIFKARGLLLHESALGQPLSKIASGQESGQMCESSVAAVAVVFTVPLPQAEGEQVVIVPNKSNRVWVTVDPTRKCRPR